MYVHFWGRGAADRIASSIGAALALTRAPRGAAAPPAPAGEDVPGAGEIQATLGLEGQVKGGVLSLSTPRPEPITMMGAYWADDAPGRVAGGLKAALDVMSRRPAGLR